MDVSGWLKEWAMPLSAGATLLLALAAFWAIWQNHLLQKRERKERLLNEIIEWAIDVLKLDSALLSLTESVRLELNLESSLTTVVDKLHSNTVAFRDRGVYIRKTAKVAGAKANDAATKLQNELGTIANLLGNIKVSWELIDPKDAITLATTEDEYSNDKDKKKDTVERHRKNLAQLCNLIIEEATKIKTNDIG